MNGFFGTGREIREKEFSRFWKVKALPYDKILYGHAEIMHHPRQVDPALPWKELCF